MLAAGINMPVPLEELESHLREEIERQMGLGRDEKEAFEISAAHIGKPVELKNEFKKEERKLMKKALIVLVGIFMILFGPAIIMPALAKHYHYGMAWNTGIFWPVVIGTIITLTGVGTVIAGFKKRKA